MGGPPKRINQRLRVYFFYDLNFGGKETKPAEIAKYDPMLPIQLFPGRDVDMVAASILVKTEKPSGLASISDVNQEMVVDEEAEAKSMGGYFMTILLYLKIIQYP